MLLLLLCCCFSAVVVSVAVVSVSVVSVAVVVVAFNYQKRKRAFLSLFMIPLFIYWLVKKVKDSTLSRCFID